MIQHYQWLCLYNFVKKLDNIAKVFYNIIGIITIPVEEKAIEYIQTVQLHQKTMKESYAMLEKNDWRLTNQEEYLKNAKLNFSRYKVLSPHWDHDHCAFCWEKFGENDENLKQGYCTPDKTYWICEECFNDFKDMFNFQVI